MLPVKQEAETKWEVIICFYSFYLHIYQCNVNNVKHNLEHRFCLDEFSPISSVKES